MVVSRKAIFPKPTADQINVHFFQSKHGSTKYAVFIRLRCSANICTFIRHHSRFRDHIINHKIEMKITHGHTWYQSKKPCNLIFHRSLRVTFEILFDTVDGRNPAPVDMVNFPWFLAFHTSQVVQDFSHQQYHSFSLYMTRYWYRARNLSSQVCPNDRF